MVGPAAAGSKPTQAAGGIVLRDGAENVYSRAGAFTFDQTGVLVAPNGMRVQGYALDGAGLPTGAPVDVDLNMINGALPPGVELTSYSIAADGTVRGVFSDGVQRDICQLAVADFTNPMGLEKIGDTAFRESANSGGVQLGVAGQGQRGQIMAGALEMSNVDLSAEFTNLILAQRGFQASSRVITTSDQVLEDLVNIKR